MSSFLQKCWKLFARIFFVLCVFTGFQEGLPECSVCHMVNAICLFTEFIDCWCCRIHSLYIRRRWLGCIARWDLEYLITDCLVGAFHSIMGAALARFFSWRIMSLTGSIWVRNLDNLWIVMTKNLWSSWSLEQGYTQTSSISFNFCNVTSSALHQIVSNSCIAAQNSLSSFTITLALQTSSYRWRVRSNNIEQWTLRSPNAAILHQYDVTPNSVFCVTLQFLVLELTLLIEHCTFGMPGSCEEWFSLKWWTVWYSMLFSVTVIHFVVMESLQFMSLVMRLWNITKFTYI